MKQYSKSNLLLNCVLRIDTTTDEHWQQIKSQAVMDELIAWQRSLFGATTPLPEILMADASTRSITVRIPKSGMDHLRAATVMVSHIGSVPVRVVVTKTSRHAPSRRPPP